MRVLMRAAALVGQLAIYVYMLDSKMCVDFRAL